MMRLYQSFQGYGQKPLDGFWCHIGAYADKVAVGDTNQEIGIPIYVRIGGELALVDCILQGVAEGGGHAGVMSVYQVG